MFSMLASVILFSNSTSVTYVRHGETVANATGKYNSRTLNTLTAKGTKQATDLVGKLKGQKYDLILVSPAERAMRTIVPYLKATHQKATIWPLLYECCTGKKEPMAKGPLKYGAKITIPKDIANYFSTIPGNDRYPDAPKYGMGLVQMAVCMKEFNAKYSGRRLLLVGHSGHGGQFIHSLTGNWKKVDNGVPITFQVATK